MLFVSRIIGALLLATFLQQPQVTITVTDASGGRVANATVVASRGSEERTIMTSADGTAALRDLAAGEWTVTVKREGFVAWEKRITISAAPLEIAANLEVAGLKEAVQVEAVAGPPDPIQLETPATGGTRLDIPIRELPASLSLIPQELIQDRGARSAIEAVQLTVGMVTSTGVGSIPGYSTRGWSGNDVSIMRDGIRQNTSSQSSRPVDTFILDRIEVLKGPASLLYGEGAIGGAVNMVSKEPKSRTGVTTLVNYGSFGSYRTGLGFNVPITRNLWGRIDSSYSSTEGYTQDSPQRLRAMAGSLRWAPTESVTLKATGTYSDDNTSSYYATPFINGQIDPRTRFFNYNMKDRLTKSHNSWGQIVGDVKLGSGWTVHNQAFAATHRLDWRNFESYVYNPATQKVDVSSLFLIWRDDILAGNRLDAHKKARVFGRTVNFTTGVELHRNDLHRGGFNGGSTIRFSVDPFNPAPIYDPRNPYQRQRDVLINTRALYSEAVLEATKHLKFVGGVRWEQIGLDYTPYPSKVTASTTYRPTTGRAGVVFDITSNANVYASYSRAVQPTTQLVDLDGSRQLFSLVPGRQFETGVKGSALRHRLDGTFAFFAIEKRDLLITTLVNNVSTNQQVGRQTTNGIEASVVARPTMRLSIAADYAITGAKFADFVEIVNGANVSRNGNIPTNIPHVVWNITPSQRIGPLDISATLRQVGARWGDTANTRHVGSYTTIDTQVAYRFAGGTRVRIRGRNLADKIYTPSVSATSGRLEAPRSIDVTVTKDF
jgi:iron complex outermembrane receptor protein